MVFTTCKIDDISTNLFLSACRSVWNSLTAKTVIDCHEMCYESCIDSKICMTVVISLLFEDGSRCISKLEPLRRATV